MNKTNCAVCAEYKDTPLRRDDMGGYVCLLCVEKRLTSLAVSLEESNRQHLSWIERHTMAVNNADTLTRQRDEAVAKQPINTSLRLFDLVRCMRAELHRAKLISDEEYGQLCLGPMAIDEKKGGSPSRARLEEYDEMRKQIATLTRQLDEALREIQDHDKQSAIQHQLIVTAEKRALEKRAEEIATLTRERDEALDDSDNWQDISADLMKDRDRLTARVAELEADRGWRTMDDAPKDGALILIWVGNPCRAQVARWCADLWDTESRYYPENAPRFWMPIPPICAIDAARSAQPEGGA